MRAWLSLSLFSAASSASFKAAICRRSGEQLLVEQIDLGQRLARDLVCSSSSLESPAMRPSRPWLSRRRAREAREALVLGSQRGERGLQRGKLVLAVLPLPFSSEAAW